jgi:acyl-coenzyme A thioesterase PaaI-like protein
MPTVNPPQGSSPATNRWHGGRSGSPEPCRQEVDQRPHAARHVASARQQGVRAKAGQSVPGQHVHQGAAPEVVGHEVLRKRGETETGARRFVQQAEVVADQAGGNVDGRAPVGLVEELAQALPTTIRPGFSVVTVRLDTNYFAPVRSGRIVASAWVVRKGKRIAHGEAVVTDEHDEMVARGWGVFAVIGAPASAA